VEHIPFFHGAVQLSKLVFIVANSDSSDISALLNNYHQLSAVDLEDDSDMQNFVINRHVDAAGWVTGRASGLYKSGCWFDGGDHLTGALYVL